MNGYGTNLRSPKVDVHDFAMIPRADIQRSSFRMQMQHKTTFSASNLIPVFLQEVLPGDSWNVACSAFARLATPIYPIFDNIDLEFFFSLCLIGLFGLIGISLWGSRRTLVILFRSPFRRLCLLLMGSRR